MAYRDLREYVSTLERMANSSASQKEVDKDWEIARCAVSFLKNPAAQRPALIFENVKGFKIPVVAGVLGASREIYALGLQTESVEGINRKWDHALGNPIAPRIVKDGPCKEEHSTWERGRHYETPGADLDRRPRSGPFSFPVSYHQRSRNRRAQCRHLSHGSQRTNKTDS